MGAFSSLVCTASEQQSGSTWVAANSYVYMTASVFGRFTFNYLSGGNEITALSMHIRVTTSYTYSYSVAVYVTNNPDITPNNYASATCLGTFSVSSGSGHKDINFSSFMTEISQFTGTWYLLMRPTISRNFTIYGVSFGSASAPSFTGTYTDGNLYINDSGVWKLSLPSINDSGVWKPSVTFINDGGVWKQGTG